MDADMIIIQTDANGGQSLGGSTPLLIQLER